MCPQAPPGPFPGIRANRSQAFVSRRPVSRNGDFGWWRFFHWRRVRERCRIRRRAWGCIMQDRQHQPGRRGLDPEHEREQRDGNSEVRHQKPRDDPSRSKLLPRTVRYLTNLLRKACRSFQVPCQRPKTAFFPIRHNSSGLEVQMAPKKSVTHFATQSRAIFVGQREKG
jgi:hypothetical protein